MGIQAQNPRLNFKCVVWILLLLILPYIFMLQYFLRKDTYEPPDSTMVRIRNLNQSAEYSPWKDGCQSNQSAKHSPRKDGCQLNQQKYLSNLIMKESGSRMKKIVLLVVGDDDEFKSVASLFKELSHSHLSQYIPFLALNERISVLPKDALEMLALGLDEQDFHCRSLWFREHVVNELGNVISTFEPDAIISSNDNGLIPQLVQMICEDENLPYIMVPTAELPLIKWIASSSMEVFRNWHIPTFRISIITATRPTSLLRLLLSLKKSHYLGDKVDIILNLESTADQDTLSVVHRLSWPFGEKSIRHRVNKGGLIAAVTESWYPGSFDEYGILLEDDIEVSKYFFVWCRYNLMQYVYGHPKNRENGLFGVSLYTPRKNELISPKPRWNSNEFFAQHTGQRHAVYIQPLPCSWGAMYFPINWLAFHHYLMYRQQSGRVVNIKGSLTNGWTASWKKYFIELAYSINWYMIYPNFENQTSFSTNHLGEGEHIQKAGGDAAHLAIDYTVPLVEDFQEVLEQLPGHALPPLKDLAAISLLGKFIPTTRLTTYDRSKFVFSNFLTEAGKSVEQVDESFEKKKRTKHILRYNQ